MCVRERSHHELAEEVQPCTRLPPTPVEAADFQRALADEQDEAAGQETQQGEGQVDEELQEEGCEGQASPG